MPLLLESLIACLVAYLLGVALAWLFLGERPGWHHVVGAALILPSIWLATRRQG